MVGSSTGGPQALTELFMNMVPPLPVPVFVAQHMPSPFTAALAKRLTAQSGHDVTEAKDGEPIVNGRVYIGQGGLHLRMGDGVVHVCPDAGESLYQPSADVLASSALEFYGKNLLAVMLTGLGRDGTKEFTKIKKAGGWTIAQDAQAAPFSACRNPSSKPAVPAKPCPRNRLLTGSRKSWPTGAERAA